MGVKNSPIIRPCLVCGRDYEYRRASGRTFNLCEHCRMPDCVVCGKKVPIERGRKNTCSDVCHRDKIKGIQNRHYAKCIAEDPDYNKRHHARAKQARLENDEKMEEYKSRESERNKRRHQNSEYLEKRKAYHAKWYRLKYDEIQKQRAEFWANLNEEEREERRLARREQSRESKRRMLERIRKDPEEWAKYQKNQRQAYREYKRRVALAKLMKQTQEILNVADEKSDK